MDSARPLHPVNTVVFGVKPLRCILFPGDSVVQEIEREDRHNGGVVKGVMCVCVCGSERRGSSTYTSQVQVRRSRYL